MIAAVHQFVPTFEPGAVGAHTIELQRVLRAMGLRSEIYTEHIAPSLAGAAQPLARHAATKHTPGEVLVYQLAIGSVVADHVLARNEPLIVNYHNITPAEVLAPWEPGLVHGSAWGRGQLRELAQRAVLGVAVSRYNEAELEDAGYAETAVAPVLMDLDGLGASADEEALDALRAAKRDGGADVLFVGRIVPNKAQHDLILAFAAYRAAFDPLARLHLVGGSSSPRYHSALQELTTELGLDGSVLMTGPVSAGRLAAHYRTADVFVCLSEHEGFCVPLIEAMHNGVPVVAFAAAAVPETLGPAGILLPAKQPAVVAGAIHRVVSDPSVRTALVEAGRERLAGFGLAAARDRNRAVFEAALADLA